MHRPAMPALATDGGPCPEPDTGQGDVRDRPEARPGAVDRRAARTRRALARSFVALARQRGYDGVDVVAICAAADVARSTFYAHYAGKHDLKRRAMGAHLTALVEAEADPLGFSMALLRHAREHRDLSRAMRGTDGARIAREVLAAVVHARVRAAVPQAPGAVVAFVARGWLALHDWWLADGARQSVDEVDAVFRSAAAGAIRDAGAR
jgi:AcrR family transcriptional regulator